jgi:hypothetical protein
MLSPTFRYIHPLLEIPVEVQATVLPDASLSVLDFLQFPLPVISGAAPRQKASEFFSNHEPTVQDIQTIRRIPVPPAKTVTDIVAACKAAIATGSRSMTCPHVPSASGELVPIWIIPYWAEVLQLRTTSRKAWVKAEEFLRTKKKVGKGGLGGEKVDEIMQQAYDILSCLPWCGDVQGFDHREPLYQLAIYASRAWLGTTHENQILDLLRRDLLLKGSRVEVPGMAFFTTLCEAYNCRNTGEYEESQHFAWIREIGKALVLGDRDGLGTMANIGGDHWVAIALEFEGSLIWYGDSFGHDAVEEVTSVMDWWTFHHTGRKFGYRKLKISSQKDGFSCGLLGPNALFHFYLPDLYPLIDVAKVDAERAKLLLRVAQRHLDQSEVSQLHLPESAELTYAQLESGDRKQRV